MTLNAHLHLERRLRMGGAIPLLLLYDMIYDILYYMIRYDMIYLLTAIGLTPGGSSTVNIYIQTIHRTTQ